MKKLTQEQINSMKEEYAKGNIFIKDLVKKYNVSASTGRYYLSEGRKNQIREYERMKYNKLSKEERHKRYLKLKDYQSKYFKERYHTDPDFRAKHQERARKCKRSKKE